LAGDRRRVRTVKVNAPPVVVYYGQPQPPYRADTLLVKRTEPALRIVIFFMGLSPPFRGHGEIQEHLPVNTSYTYTA